MPEKVFIFRREYCLPYDCRNVFVLDDLPSFSGQFKQDLTVRIVNVACGGRLETKEGFRIGQIRAVEADVKDREYRKQYRESGSNARNQEKSPCPACTPRGLKRPEKASKKLYNG
ncbi:MAG: hypothetical protein WA857_05670 [Candidatus Acidiferrum sp.]